MENKSTFFTYICSNDIDKLTQFIWDLPYRIEIKGTQVKGDKWYVLFNHASSRHPDNTKLKNVNLDEI